MNLSEKMTAVGPAILRIGMAVVFLWFGFQQFLNTMAWIGFIPEEVLKIVPLEASTLVHVNGAFEIVFGFALLLGFFTRMSALFLSLHMFHITTVVGYDSIGVRDFGLMIAVIAVFLNGADHTSIDQFLFFRKQKEVNNEKLPLRVVINSLE